MKNQPYRKLLDHGKNKKERKWKGAVTLIQQCPKVDNGSSFIMVV